MPHQAVYEANATPRGHDDGGRVRAFGLLAVAWLLAASVFVVVKWAGAYTPPWELVFCRLLLAALCLVPFARSSFGAMASQAKAHLGGIVAIGASLAFTQGFMFTALGYTTAINASIVFSIWPITAIVLAAFVLGERFTLRQGAGVVLCFAGVLVIVAQGQLTRLAALDLNVGDLWILGSIVGMSTYTVLLKRLQIDLPPLPLLILVLAVGALASSPLMVWELLNDPRSAVDWHDVAALAYIGVIGGGFMFLLYNTGVSILGASEASVTFYLQALFTAILAYVFLGERLHLYHVVGTALIAIGIVIVLLLQRAREEPPQPAAHAGGD